jgi:SAM-dependent methyltransferase
MAPVEEPVLESAPLARDVAVRLCRRDPETGESCSWYHGLWQYLRLLRLVATPEHHADFYRDALATVANASSAPRLLIAGTADYSMLAHVLALCNELQLEPDLTVTDLCETPLWLNRWYADRAGRPISAHRCDILQYPQAPPFDAVCTHSFLGRFPPAERVRLVEKWHQLLRPGGRVITVKRIRPGAGAAPTGFTEDQALAFQDKVLAAATALRGTLGVDPARLADEAGVYASRNRTWPIQSREEIRELFERAGFEVNRLTCAPVASTSSRAGGPTMLGGAEYAQIVATRL